MIEEKLLLASEYQRNHQDILALALDDRKRLEELCAVCKEDFRDLASLAEQPERYLSIPRKDDAAAEFARRYELLGFPDVWRFAYWGQRSKCWKKEWPNQPPEKG